MLLLLVFVAGALLIGVVEFEVIYEPGEKRSGLADEIWDAGWAVLTGALFLLLGGAVENAQVSTRLWTVLVFITFLWQVQIITSLEKATHDHALHRARVYFWVELAALGLLSLKLQADWLAFGWVFGFGFLVIVAALVWTVRDALRRDAGPPTV